MSNMKIAHQRLKYFSFYTFFFSLHFLDNWVYRAVTLYGSREVWSAGVEHKTVRKTLGVCGALEW